ncbi:MurR/RpiR family transcriptional regulator [Enterococcus saccharolyticus]|uniref:MurR/RpiR family transcriptional regulator n=1 Tax=Enterococcus TaxID=1350 RepID=UPI001E520A91|nr:MurR/RpiR family transcriptional regulator [Enterococcus saccharolyticus]MCD5002300.1 MurR/RpiR family transcriptional regulator [Enterococcus saccharolyticus]
MNILFTIQNQLDSLSKAEKKLAQWILEHSAEVIHMSAKTLSEAAEISPATVVRFCYSLGLEGFPDLKLKLSANLPQIQEGLYSDIVPDESITTIKQKIKFKVIDGIEKNCELLEDEAIEQILHLLDHSEVIFTYGIGASGTVADDFYQKFLRVGRTVIFSQDAHLLSTAIVTNKESAFIFLISNSGEKKEVCRLASLAKNCQIPVVSMTSQPRSTLARLSDIVLHTTDGGEAPLRSSATNSLLVQLYSLDVLFSAYASKHYDETIIQLEQTKQAISQLEE